MPLTWTSRIEGCVPIDMTGVTPDRVRGRNAAEIAKLTVWRGRRQIELGELFHIGGDSDDGVWHFAGEMGAIHHLGDGMTAGAIEVDGDIGRHAGATMSGGRLTIHGSAGDWCGAEMQGGTIHVGGNAGDYVGSCYVGSSVGMRGGTITVVGNAGRNAGEAMRRGWISIGGDCGPWPGYRMRAGTLFVCGNSGGHPGAEMKRGTLGLFGADPPSLLPTFAHACQITPVTITMMLRKLAGSGFEPAAPLIGHPLNMANGDLLEGGRGELFWSSK